MHTQSRRTKEHPSYFAFPYTQNKCIKFCGRREENRGVVECSWKRKMRKRNEG